MNCRLFALVFVLFAGLTGLPRQSQANHMMGADIWYKYIGPNQYEITVSIYKDCNATLINMGPTITVRAKSASCGVTTALSYTLPVFIDSLEVSPLCPNQIPLSVCNGGTLPGVLQFVYKGIITLPQACNDWIVYYENCCRNDAITTIDNPDGYGLWVEVKINSTAGMINSSPSFTTLPVPFVCVNQPYFYSHGAFDQDGDSLVYTLINPLDDAPPAAQIPYMTPYSAAYPLATTTGTVDFDAASGQISFTPNSLLVTVVAVRVDEYRNGQFVGSSMRDIQLAVIDCANSTPVVLGNPSNVQGGTATGPTALQVCPGQVLSFDITATDPNPSDIITFEDNTADVLPGATITGTGTNPLNLHFEWQPSGLDTGFHSFTLTIIDDNCPLLGQNTFSYQIYVLSGTSAGPDITICGNQTAQLQATGGNAFVWSPATGLDNPNIANPISSTTVTTTYTVTGNLGTACNNTDEMVVFYVPDFTLTAPTADTLCVGESVSLTTSVSGSGAPFTYQWLPALGLSATNTSDVVASPPYATTYTLNVTSTAGCQKTAQIPLIIAGIPPTITIASVDSICAGSGVELTATISGGSSTVTCTPNLNCGSGTGDYINNFTFHTLVNNNTACMSGTAPSTLGYIYYPNSPTTAIMAGATYPLSIQSGSASLLEGFAMWIDYNQDGDFDDADEYVYNSVVTGNSSTVFTGNVTVPMTAIPGTTRLRVMCRRSNVPLANQSCNTFTYGEAEDYDITIIGPAGDLVYSWSPATGLSDSTTLNPIAFPNQTTTYTLTASYSGMCSSSATVVVYVKQATSSNIGDTVVCANSAVTLQPSQSASDFTWTSNPPGFSSTEFAPVVNPQQTTTYFFSGTNNNACIQDSFVVTITPAPAVGLTPAQPTSICTGNNITLSVAGPYDEFSWSPSSTLSDNDTSTVIASPDVTTTYTVNVSNSSGCVASDSVVITVLAEVTPQTIGDTSVCPGNAVVLSTTQPFATYAWQPSGSVANPAAQTTNASPATTTTYTVTVSDAAGCSGSDSMVVNVFPMNNVTFENSVVELLPGEEVTLNAVVFNGVTYTWTTPDGVSTGGASLTVQPANSGLYSVTVTDGNGCTSTAQVQVNVVPACLALQVANAFTPNGDNINDKFVYRLQGGLVEFRSASIYNRWGEKVFESSILDNYWDGTFRNEPAPIGAYVYHITTFCEGAETVKSGSVLLLR